MKMPSDWAVFRQLLGTVTSDVKSSLVEGHVPQKLIGYPINGSPGQSVHKKPILFTAALSSPTRPLPRPEGSPLVNSDKPGAHSKKNCQITTDPETRADKRVQAKQSALRRPPPLGFKWGGRSGMLMGHWTRTEAVRLCADTIHCCSTEIVYHLRQNQSE